MPTIDAGTLTLVAIIALLALALVAASIAIVFHARAQRLPAATRYEDIYERLGTLQTTLTAKQIELREVEQKIYERDRYAAEAASLMEQVDKLRLEHENLAPARAEIEAVKAEAAAAAAEKVTVDQRLSTAKDELARVLADLDPHRVGRLRQELEDLRREVEQVTAQLGPLRAERDAAVRISAEARETEARIAALRARQAELEEQIQGARSTLEDAASASEAARQERDKLIAEARDAERAHDAASKAVEAYAAQREEIVARIATLEATRAGLEVAVDTLEALRDRIKNEITELGSAKGTKPLTPEERAELLKDLVTEPACLGAPINLRHASRDEIETLHHVQRYLESCGLTFADRTLRAFHTSMKISDTAQMTILAGVSGTGKSLLPRRYAEAMGIHFLQVAVEPRWDSPQDMLGFYNYVEKKYRATELARLLAHLDPWNSHKLPADMDRRNHMAIVLLDEMNLARVEYYFSEFLSRLEARPTWTMDLLKDRAKDALIPVDIRGLENPPTLFPAYNVLFVGTMNDDESTQSLSDKVLDRGNVLQFPAPMDFRAQPQTQAIPSGEAQRFSEWRGWVRSPDAIGTADQILTDKVIEDLSHVMQAFGRPFGYRLNQSMRAYAASYPYDQDAGFDVRVPLADQVEFRILPKLRGVEIDTHRDAFDQLQRLVRDRLADAQLADQIEQNKTDQSGTSGLFVWRGLLRGA